MKLSIVHAGTKYVPTAFSSSFGVPYGRVVILALRIPSRHLLRGSKTPDPDFPSVSTSLIRVGNLRRNSGESCSGGAIIFERLVPSLVTNTTASSGRGGSLQ